MLLQSLKTWELKLGVLCQAQWIIGITIPEDMGTETIVLLDISAATTLQSLKTWELKHILPVLEVPAVLLQSLKTWELKLLNLRFTEYRCVITIPEDMGTETFVSK